MTIRTISVPALKSLKNSVIGNPSAKAALAQDEAFVRLSVYFKLVLAPHFLTSENRLVDCVNAPESYTDPADSPDDIRVEAAHVLSSIAYGKSTFYRMPLLSHDQPNSGSEEALGTLLRANAHQAFLYALSNLSPTDSPASKSAFARGLRVLAVAVADTIGPSQWGLKQDTCSVRHEAKFALEYLFKVIHLLCAVVIRLYTNQYSFPARRS
jgi:hypothetical protein